MPEWLMQNPILWVGLAAILPIILPPKKIYGIFNPLGFLFRKFKIQTESQHSKMKGVIAYVWNTIFDAIEAFSDGAAGRNKYKDKKD